MSPRTAAGRSPQQRRPRETDRQVRAGPSTPTPSRPTQRATRVEGAAGRQKASEAGGDPAADGARGAGGASPSPTADMMMRESQGHMDSSKEWGLRLVECNQCRAKGLPSEGCRRCAGHGYVATNIALEEMERRAQRRKHHTMPVWYQKNFMNDDSKVFYWKKGDQKVQSRHPAAVFFKLDAYNVFDQHGNLVAESESVYAYLDMETKGAADRTLAAYAEAARTNSREVNAARAELEVLVSMLLIRETSFQIEATELYKTNNDHKAPEAHDQLARVAIIKHGADLAQRRDPNLMAADFSVSGHTEKEGLIFGDGVICNIKDDNVELRVLPLTPKVAAIWSWPVNACQPRQRRTWTLRGRIPRREITEINSQLCRKSRAIGGPSRRQIETMHNAYARRYKRQSRKPR